MVSANLLAQRTLDPTKTFLATSTLSDTQRAWLKSVEVKLIVDAQGRECFTGPRYTVFQVDTRSGTYYVHDRATGKVDLVTPRKAAVGCAARR